MIVVIGASGFIGTYLVEQLLVDGYKVISTGRNEDAEKYFQSRDVDFINLDLTNELDFEKLPKENVEAVILLAALLPANSQENNPYDYLDINIKGVLNTLEYCRKNKIDKLISTTSYADVKNFWNENIPIPSNSLRSYSLEDDHACYIISKNAASDFIEYYNEQYNFFGIIFRLPMVYGYGPHSELFANGKWYKSGFQVFIDKAIEGADIEIFGDENTSRDVVYVKDVVSAFILAIKADNAKGMYNLSSGIGLTLDEQVKSTVDLYTTKNRSQIIYSKNKKNNSKSFIFDISRTVEDLGYKPHYIPFSVLLDDYKKESELKRFPHLIRHSYK